MEMLTKFLSVFANSALQLVFLGSVPFVWWLVTARKTESFFSWLGLKPIKGGHPVKLFAVSIAGLVLLAACGVFIVPLLTGSFEAVSGGFESGEAAALPSILVYAFIHTSLAEEIFFRGFLGKRLSSALGFRAGNAAQAAVYGLLNGAMLFFSAGFVNAIVIGVITGGIGALIGYMDEHLADGSILPSWLLRGVATTLTILLATTHPW